MKEKQCKHCNTKENLRTNKNGVIYNCCIKCYEEIEIPFRIKQTEESIKKKHGVSNLGELRQKRLKEKPPKEKEKPIKVCKYCGSFDVIIKKGSKRTIEFPVCKKHWEQYQKEKHEARKKTNLEKFGSDHPMHVKELADKQKQVIHNRTNEDKARIAEKRQKTNIEKYGVKDPVILNKFKEKRKKTYLEKYGVENPMQLDKFKEKQKQTLLKNYNVDNPLKSKKIQNKVKQTNINKRNVSYPSQCNNVVKKSIKKRRSLYWNTFIELLNNKNIEPLFTKEEYINSVDELQYKCTRPLCNNIFFSSGTEPQRISCGCYRKRSKYEDEVIDWLKSINILEIESNKKFYENGRIRFEIDIYLSKYGLGIDFHGLFWHNDLSIRKSYHQEKYLYFREQNIQLIQIFENEWLSKNNTVKSIIKNKLKLNKTIFARKCEIKEVPTKESRQFFEINHLQSYASSSINIGLVNKGVLVCIGSFGKDRFSKEEGTFELIRFANKIDVSVVGGFQRILKYFENTCTPKKIISYIDLRYFSGTGYIKAGFTKDKITQPNYFYFKSKNPSILYNRMAFQKHKLSNILDNFNPALSEADNMYKNDYLRIYDAGNLKVSKLI